MQVENHFLSLEYKEPTKSNKYTHEPFHEILGSKSTLSTAHITFKLYPSPFQIFDYKINTFVLKHEVASVEEI